jgi:hypothetical protein
MRKKIMIFLLATMTAILFSIMTPVTANPSSNYRTLSISSDPPGDLWMVSGNGEKVNITAGNRAQIRTMAGNHIRVRTNESCQICVNECDNNPVGPILNQTRATNRYMNITMNCTCEMNATMFRNYTNQQLEGLGNVSTFRWAWYDEAQFRWQYAEQNWVEKTSSGATVFCNTTHFSIWTILAPENNPTPGNPFDAPNGTGFALQAGNMYQLRTQSGFAIQIKLNAGAEMTINEYENSPQAMNRERHRIRTQTMALELNDSSVQFQANLSYQFTEQKQNQYGVQNKNKLKFMFFNETTDKWEEARHQWLEGETLYCNTTHFSLWTIAEEESSDSIPGFTIVPLFLAIIPVIIIRIKRRS